MTLTVIVVVLVIEIEQERECQRRHLDPLLRDTERDGKIAGDGDGPLSRSRGVDQGFRGQREPCLVVARRGEDGLVQLGRRLPEQARHSAGARDHIFPVGVLHRFAALRGEESDGDALRYDDGEQQEERELAREARGRKPHSRSTLPANR